MSNLQDAEVDFAALQLSNAQPRDDESSVYDRSVKSESNSSSSEEQTGKPCDGADTSLPSQNETTKKALTLPQDRTAEHSYAGETSEANKGEKADKLFVFPTEWTAEQCHAAKESARSEEGQCFVYLSLPQEGYGKIVLAYEGSALPGPSRRFRGHEACYLGSDIEDLAHMEMGANRSRYATPEDRATLLKHYLDALQKYSEIDDVTWLALSSHADDKIQELPFGKGAESVWTRLEALTDLNELDRNSQRNHMSIARAREAKIRDGLASEAQESGEHQSPVEVHGSASL